MQLTTQWLLENKELFKTIIPEDKMQEIIDAFCECTDLTTLIVCFRSMYNKNDTNNTNIKLFTGNKVSAKLLGLTALHKREEFENITNEVIRLSCLVHS